MLTRITLNLLFTDYAGRRRHALSIVPTPLGIRLRRRIFSLGSRAKLCVSTSRKSGGVLRSCLITSSVGLGPMVTRRKRGIILGRITRLPRMGSSRKCILAMAPRRMLVHTASKTKLFCKIRAVLRVISRGKLPTKIVASRPHFTCHNFVVSISHRFFSGRFVGGRVSTLTCCGLGHLRLRLASTTN